jgi:predicted O-methyltransferase YrrM
MFSDIGLRRFRHTLQLNGFSDVISVATDVKRYSLPDSISFCLLDVDLYKPTLYALETMWPRLSTGAIVVVDDCKDFEKWDGAYQAYIEFTSAMKLKPQVVLEKLGIIRKDSH